MPARRALLAAAVPAHSRSRRLLFLVVCSLLLGSAGGWASDGPAAPDAALQRLDQAVALLETLRSSIDRSAFDVDALAARLASEDAAWIAAWVEREIAFEPYAGVLRGPRGSLMARAGNAVDQALLLAELLRAAGYETRVALGRLDDRQAEVLLRRTWAPRAAPPAVGDLDAMAETLDRLAELLELPRDKLVRGLEVLSTPAPVAEARVLAEVATRHDALRTALAAAGVELGEGARGVLLEEARAYAWVEARARGDEPWAAFHPTGLDPAEAVAATSYVDADTMANLEHRIRVGAWIEREVDGVTERSYVMEPVDRPVADLIGTVIDYTHVPDAFENAPVAEFDLDAVLAATTYYVPYLMGRPAPGAEAFDLCGATVHPDVALGGPPPAGALVERAASAFGALGGTPATPSPGVLVGQGLSITLVAPGGHETTHLRWWWSGHGGCGDDVESVDAAIEVGRALMRHDRIVVVAGALPPGFLLDEAISHLVGGRDLLAQALIQVAAFDPEATLDADALPPESPVAHLLLADAFDAPLAVVGDAAGHRAGASVIAIGSLPTPDHGVRVDIDIVSNERRVVGKGAAGEPAIAPQAAMLRGVWETLAEREALRDSDATRLASAADGVGPFMVLRSADDAGLAALELDADMLRNVRADLERGFIVLLPEDGEHAGGGWWRVDPTFGTTLGVAADGRGQAMSEYAIKTYDASYTVLFALKSLLDCRGKGGIAEACCLVKAHLNNLMGLGFGGAIGGVAGSSAALAFTLASGFGGADFVGAMGLVCP